MKKYIFVVFVIFMSLVIQLTAGAFPPPQPTAVNYVMPVPGVNSMQNKTYNRIIIQSGNNTYITTSPVHPRQSYTYKDFAAPQRYPNRNYYVPSYCMHDSYVYYGNGYNPFCSQYRRYGNGMYINF